MMKSIPIALSPTRKQALNVFLGLVVLLVAVLLLLALAFLWTHHGAGNGWSWVRTLGTNSLLVYWVHIELVYGRWFGYWKESLTVSQCALAAVTLIFLMLALCWIKANWNLPSFRMGALLPEPRRVSGD